MQARLPGAIYGIEIVTRAIKGRRLRLYRLRHLLALFVMIWMEVSMAEGAWVHAIFRGIVGYCLEVSINLNPLGLAF